MPQSAIVYARFSSAEQKKGFSLERQQSLALHFATEQGWEVVDRLSDEGRSAYHGTNRLEGAALHQFEIEARNGLHRGKVLVVENIDRLSRQGAKAAAQLIWALNEAGVDVATFHDQHVYRAGSESEMIDLFKVIILAQQAHDESDKKSKRTSASWQKRFERMAEGTQKNPIPHTPHWIDKIDDKMVLNAKRTALLNEIYDLYINGVGIHRIVSVLNERDEPRWTPEKSQRVKNGWFYSYIYRLLTKRTVLGEYVTMDGKTVAANFYPQAVSAEKFNQAQAALAMRKGNQKKDKRFTNRNLLQGIVFCDQCGGGAHFGHTTNSEQKYVNAWGQTKFYRRKTYRKLRCDRARRKHACDNGTILNYDVVEATVLNQLLPMLVSKHDQNTEAAALRQQIAELARLRDADQDRVRNLIEALEDGGSKSITSRISALEATIEQHDAAIEQAQRTLAMETSKPSSDDDVEAIVGLRNELISEDDEIRTYARGRVNMMLRRLIKRIAITNTGCFRIEPDHYSWWLFDEEGRMLEGAYAALPTAAAA